MKEKMKKILNITIVSIFFILFINMTVPSTQAVVIVPTPSAPFLPPKPKTIIKSATASVPVPICSDYLVPKGTVLKHIDGSASVADGTTSYDMSKWSVASGATPPTPPTSTLISFQQQISALQQQILILQRRITLFLEQLKSQ